MGSRDVGLHGERQEVEGKGQKAKGKIHFYLLLTNNPRIFTAAALG